MEQGPLEPPRASGTAPLPACPAGDGPLQAGWDCTPDDGAKLAVSAEVDGGVLKLRVEGQALPAYRPIQVRIDLEPDGRADVVASGRADASGALAIEQFNPTCAEHLEPVVAASDFCELAPAVVPAATAVP